MNDHDAAAPTVVPTSLPARRLRLLELLLICAIAFGGNLIYSFGAVVMGADLEANSGATNTLRGLDAVANQIIVLAALAYVLFRQGRGLADIGWKPEWKDIPRSLGLAVVAGLVTWVVEWLLFYGGYFLTGHVPQTQARNVGFLLGGPSAGGMALLLLYVLVNPWLEELVARAYVMTEVKALTGRTGAAVFVSVTLQACYHLYQGVFPALAYAALFLVFSHYYARSGRILPIILAHLYFDLQTLFP